MKVSVQHKICLISSRIKIKTPTRVEHLQISSELDSSQQIRLPEINIDCSDCSSQSIHQKQKQKKLVTFQAREYVKGRLDVAINRSSSRLFQGLALEMSMYLLPLNIDRLSQIIIIHPSYLVLRILQFIIIQCQCVHSKYKLDIATFESFV